MPPGRTKKKIKNHDRPSLAFIKSPTPSTIKFSNYAGSQQQTLEASTVPYTEGGKWLSTQFSNTEHKINIKSRRPGQKAKNVTVDAPNEKRQWHTRRSRSSGSNTAYAPLEITVTSKASKKTNCDSEPGEGAPLRENVRSGIPAKSSNTSDSLLNMPSAALAVTTPVFERSDLEALKLGYTGSAKHGRENDNCSSGNELDCGKHKAGNGRKLFQSSSSDNDIGQEADVLVPDTPEREYGFSFHKRWRKLLKEKG